MDSRDGTVTRTEGFFQVAVGLAPVPVGDEKIAFTVKLSRGLVAQVRSYARTKRLSLSELVSRALCAWLRRR
jgi:hypothetical protein